MNLTSRDCQPTDHDFILATWLKSYREIGPITNVSGSVYFKEHQQRVKDALARSRTIIACAKDEPDQIFGYMTVEGDALHFIYVKSAMRKFGVASMLLAQAPIKNFTHMTNCARYFKRHGWVYNPYLFYGAT